MDEILKKSLYFMIRCRYGMDTTESVRIALGTLTERFDFFHQTQIINRCRKGDIANQGPISNTSQIKKPAKRY